MLYIERLDGSERLGHSVDLSTTGVRFRGVGPRITLSEVLKVGFSLGTEMFTFFGTTVRVSSLDPFAQEVSLAFAEATAESHALLRRAIHPEFPGTPSGSSLS